MIRSLGLQAGRRITAANLIIRPTHVRAVGVPAVPKYLVASQYRTVVSRAAKRLADKESGIKSGHNSANEARAQPQIANDSNKSQIDPVSEQPPLRTQTNNVSGTSTSAAFDHPIASSKESTALKLFPKFMRGYASKITNAPVSHITAFSIVHELSAIVPLFGVWGLLHYFDYAPIGILPDWIVANGMGFIRRMAERNDWTMLATAESGSRLLMQGAAAYAIVKATLPFRLIFSLWAMPYFARWFISPINMRSAAVFKRLTKRAPKTK